jgi:parallel beta helix pectate lyase-like protein
MMKTWLAGIVVAALASGWAASASASVIIITQQNALAGGVTPGDAKGFPVTLSLAGSYRFDTNLAVPAGVNGIVVASHYVDIDMNGFRLYGWNGAGTQRVANYGVISNYGISKIHDGFISGFKFAGIYTPGNSNQWLIQNMTIAANGGSGILTASYARIVNNTIDSNASSGIICGEFCHVEGNLVASNAHYGIYLTSGLVLGNTVADNGNHGIWDDSFGGDAGLANNMLIDNNPTGSDQIAGGVNLQPNACFGRPC